MKKNRKSKKWIILVLILLLAAAGAFYVFFWKDKAETQTASRVTNAKTVKVYRGDIRVVTEGNGSIEAAKETSYSSDYSVRIDTVEAEKGDVVKSGDVIAVINKDSIEDQIDQINSSLSEINTAISNADKSGSSSLTAPVSGRIKRIYVKADEVLTDVVEKHGGIMEISADGRLKVEIPVSDAVKVGDVVQISFLNYDVDGTVMSQQDGKFTVTFEDSADYPVDIEAVVTDKNDKNLGSGYLKSNHPYLVDASYGVAEEIHVSLGDRVDSGANLLTRKLVGYNAKYLKMVEERQELMEKLQKLRELKADPLVKAESSGIISEMLISDDMMLAEKTVMYRLISTDSFWLKTEIDELDIAEVSVGQKAVIVFDAFDEEEYEGKVEKISSLGQNTGGVTKYTVTISVPGIEKVKTAMSATATIEIASSRDTLIIPVDAVSTIDGQKCVTVVNGEGQNTVNVTLGLVNNTEAEVTEGLSEGDEILIYGKSDLERMMDVMRQSRQAVRGGEN